MNDDLKEIRRLANVNPRAFVILPESEATIDFIATFPHDIEIAVLPDDAFEGMVERAREQGEGRKTLHIPEDPTETLVKDEKFLSEEYVDEIDELTGDIGVADGC